MTSESPVTLVTGANRGMGLEIARQLARRGHRVVVGARDDAKGRAAAAELDKEGMIVFPVALDVTNSDGTGRALAEIESRHGAIDVLINNAAILIDGPGGFEARLLDLTDETMRLTWETNVLGPTRLIKAVLPSMIARGYGRIVNMSSAAGQLQHMTMGFPAYRMSKTALNALTRIAANEAGSGNVKVNACSPGWVRTEMGGPNASRSVEKGAETPVWLATLGPDGPTGGFFQDKASIAW